MASSAARKAFGRLLRRYRLAKGLTQRRVSRELQYSTGQFVSSMERGVALPPLDALPVLARLYGLKLRVLGREFFDACHADVDEKQREWLRGLKG